MNQANVIQFPNKTYKSQKNPDRIIIFTTNDNHEYRIKAKYKKVITDTTNAILEYYSKISETG